MSLFNSNTYVGVAITPEHGLEVAQIDFATRTVIKYGCKDIEYNNNTRSIADLDIFKQELRELLGELNIPPKAGIILSIPTVAMKINDYPASLSEEMVENAITEDLYENVYFKDEEPAFSATLLPTSNMQMNKIAYTAAQKTMLIEMVLIIKDLGRKVVAIDTSSSTTFNALSYLGLASVEAQTPWVLLLIESTYCRIMSMVGNVCMDVVEEKLSIGQVLTDAENYSTVISTVEPLLKNLPSKFLHVVSKTNIISAEVLANRLSYSASITNQEANGYLREPIINLGPLVEQGYATQISLDVIGAAIYPNFIPYVGYSFNLYNKSLGDVFLVDQPLEISVGSKKIVFSFAYVIKMFLVIFAVLASATFCIYQFKINPRLNELNDEISRLDARISEIDRFLKANESISRNEFDEGEQVSIGLGHNKNIYSYYTIVGTEIPKKLWLTYLNFGDDITIEGQADNLESVYAFFRAIKDYNPDSEIKLQKLSLASISEQKKKGSGGNFDTASLLTSMEADFYEFRISNAVQVDTENQKKNKKESKKAKLKTPPLETIKE